MCFEKVQRKQLSIRKMVQSTFVHKLTYTMTVAYSCAPVFDNLENRSHM